MKYFRARVLTRSFLLLAWCPLALAGCVVAQEPAPARSLKETTTSPRRINSTQLINDLRELSSDAFAGRKTGTPGSAKARAYLLEAFQKHGLKPFNHSFTQTFSFTKKNKEYQGTNVIGYLEGTANPSRYVVLTAHYDHEGIVNGEIYNGADDNASGVAALLALAAYFKERQPLNSIIFAALDAEELGLEGARAFVAHPPVDKKSIALNLNMDMISRSDRRELYVAGTYHYPYLQPYIEKLTPTARVKLLIGHDRPTTPKSGDWTNSSDHAPFHQANIPFLYLGVEDHQDYHKPTDDFARVNQTFYLNVVETVLDVVQQLDQNLSAIIAARQK